MGLDRDMRVEGLDGALGAGRLRLADVVRPVDHLPLQVRQRDDVVVDDADRADAGGGEVEDGGRAEAAGADHEHARALQRLLARAADLPQHDVAGIALDLVGREGHGPRFRPLRRQGKGAVAGAGPLALAFTAGDAMIATLPNGIPA